MFQLHCQKVVSKTKKRDGTWVKETKERDGTWVKETKERKKGIGAGVFKTLRIFSYQIGFEKKGFLWLYDATE